MRLFRTRILPPLLVLIATLGVWEAIVVLFKVPRFLLPRPGAVALAIRNNHASLQAALANTAEASLIGFAASAVLGIAAAVVLASSTWVRRAFYPYTVFFQTVPVVAIAPLLVLWFDPGLTSVAISAFIVSVFPVIAGTLSGMLSTDPALVDLFALYGANPWAKLWKLRLPAALPDIITGLRVAAGLAVIGTVVSEFVVGLIGEGEGLGIRIISAKKVGRTDMMFAAVLITSLLGLAMFGAVNLAGRLLLRRWHASEKD